MNETSEKPPISVPVARRSSRPYLWPLYRSICGRSDWPILVGPWRGEVGFEVLYWLPFLEHLIHTYQIPRERLIPITRGGAAMWYGCPQGLELYAMRTPQEVRVENRIQHQQWQQLKQTHVTPWDRRVLRDAADTLKLGRYLTLHPSWLYQTLKPFWEAERGLAWLQTRTRFSPLPDLTLDGVTLPERFVAVRFYFRATYRATALSVELAKHTIRMIAKQTPVVVLTQPDYLDDHADYLPTNEPNVTVLSKALTLTPQTNLAVQAAVLQRALGFVGTYGGMAQLALRLNKPTICLYDEWQGTALPHRHLSEALALQMGTMFSVLRIGDLPRLQASLPQVITSA